MLESIDPLATQICATDKQCCHHGYLVHLMPHIFVDVKLEKCC